ncbi:MAG TPA: glycogen debranching protein GlgX [Blastocatellia bacterium]|nr:glycogen debranching protein GlgX [Blastocatellia bacterium]
MEPDSVALGLSYPIGATPAAGGVNFSVYSKRAGRVDLVLFDAVDDERPSHVIALDESVHRTGNYWNAFVPGIGPGQVYGYRVYGPFDPQAGHRFDPTKLLLDPYGRAVAVPGAYSRKLACTAGDTTASAMRSVVVDSGAFDWEDDQLPATPFSKTVIYEMHVAGFTRNPNSGVPPERRGTYAGVVDKIPYLVDLGVTAVELLPVFMFDPADAPEGRLNYWGYSPVSFFAPHLAYSACRDPLGAIREFRDMVKALHRAGIEVILDVVYNHTTEGDSQGPTLCFRGFENSTYYTLSHENRAEYANYSGTGNTLNANHSVVRRMILDSLHYWAEEMHVDGFRFDLASVLARDEAGVPLEDPPIILDIDSDPVLAGRKIIAEAWDAAGLYQVGSFLGDNWKEWNGRFRDDVRSFVRGDAGMVKPLLQRMAASPDIYGHEEREPEQSVNFVTCHDGFTLNDLVSYNEKHNLANGEDNRDGTNDNRSWNCGVEGPTDDPEVERLRNRQVKNFLVVTLLSLGTPMLLMGDEVRRTQSGNNNAYCQDNELGWFDWNLVERHAGIHRFARTLIHIRRRFMGMPTRYSMSLNELLADADVRIHGLLLDAPDVGPDSRWLAYTVTGRRALISIHLMMNASPDALDFELPAPLDPAGVPWRLWLDTSLDAPDDIVYGDKTVTVDGGSYRVAPRSIASLFVPKSNSRLA